MNSWLLKIVCVSIFAVPLASLIVMQNTIIWYPQLIMFLVFGFAIASLLIWQVNKPLSILSLYCLYSYIFVAQQHPRSLLCLVIAYLGIGFICLISKIKNTLPIYKSIIAMSLIQFVLIVAQRFNLDPFFHLNGQDGVSTTVGFLGSHNQLGIYYATVAPILFHFCFLLLPIIVFSIFFTHCTSAVAGLIAGLFTYLSMFKLNAMLIVLVMVLASGFFLLKSFDDPMFALKERVAIWKLSIKQLKEGAVKVDMGQGMTQIITKNALTGFGIGSFIMMSPRSQEMTLREIYRSGKQNGPDLGHRFEHAHNDSVEYAFEFGWLGIPILLFILWNIVSLFVTTPKTNMLIMMFASLVSQAVMSLGVYIVHAPVSYFMLCLTLGLFYAEVNNASTRIQEA